MQISVKSDVDKALKSMSRLHKKQVPFAAALGLTMWRLRDKGSPLKDAKKAEFYLCRLIQKLEQ